MMFKKIMSVILALALTVGLVGTAFADSDDEVNTDSSETSINDGYFHESEEGGYWINPSVDCIDESDLTYNTPEENEISTYATYITYTYEQAIIAIRHYMETRETEFEIRIDTQIPNWNDFFDQSICAYTGNPREGDSLWVTCQTLTYVYTKISDDCYEYDFSAVYYTTAEQEDELYSLATQLLIDLDIDSKSSDYAKFYAIYEWIVDNVYYDSYHLELSSGNQNYKWLWSAWAALATRGTICDGYAQLLYYLLTMCDVPCRYICGSTPTGAHAWDIVEINGLWYYCDPTNDAVNYAWQSPDNYTFCLKGEGNFPNHTPEARYSTEEFLSEHPIASSDYGRIMKVYIDHDDLSYDPYFDENLMVLIPSNIYANDIYARCYQDYGIYNNKFIEVANPNATESNIKSYMNDQISKGNMKKITVALWDQDDTLEKNGGGYFATIEVDSTGETAQKYYPDTHIAELMSALNGLVNFVPDGNYDWNELCQMCDVIILPFDCTESQYHLADYYATECVIMFGEEPRQYIYHDFKDSSSPITVAEAFALFYANPSYKYWNGYPDSYWVDTGEYVRSNMCQLNTMECDNNVILSPYYTSWYNPETGEECSHKYTSIDFHWAPDGLACSASVKCDVCGYEKSLGVDPSAIVVSDNVAATCTQDGYVKTMAVSRLSFFDSSLSSAAVENTYSRIIPATGHTEFVIKSYDMRENVFSPGDYYVNYAVLGCQLCDEVDFAVTTNRALGTSLSLVETGRQDATCTEGGYINFYLIIEYGATTYTKNNIRVVLYATDHNWGTPQYDWSDDYSSCIVSMVCKNCNLYTSTSCDVVRTTILKPTTLTNGIDIVVATAELNDIVCTDEQNIYTPKIDAVSGATYNFSLMTYSFNVEGGIATVNVPYMDSDEVDTFDIPVTYNVKYDSNGVGIMTLSAKFELDGETFNLTSEEYSADILTEHTWALSSETEPSCTESGISTYVCSDCDETMTVEYEPTGHNWSEPVFEWNDDYSECSAVFTCQDCGTIEAVDADIASEEIDGNIVYTATAEFNSNEYTDTQTIKLDKNKTGAINASGSNDDNDTDVINDVTLTDNNTNAFKDNTSNNTFNTTSDNASVANNSGDNTEGISTTADNSETMTNETNATVVESPKTGNIDFVLICFGVVAIIAGGCITLTIRKRKSF